jgi:hypothetical protein
MTLINVIFKLMTLRIMTIIIITLNKMRLSLISFTSATHNIPTGRIMALFQ